MSVNDNERSGGFVSSPQIIQPSGLPRVEDAFPASPSSTGQLQPGSVVAGKFTLKRIIAAGGTATVFEAWDMLIERPVALKLLHPQLVQDQTAVARFRREAQA